MATEIQKALEATTTELKELLETQSQEIKQFGETSKETAARIAELEKSLQGMAEDSKERELKMQERIDELEAAGKRIGAGGPDGIKSVGRQFTQSEAYEHIKAAGFRGESRPVEVKAITNAAISGDGASAGGLLTPYLRDAILQEPNQILFAHQLIPNIPVNTDAVQLFREVGFDNEAGIQPAPVASGASAGLQAKPQSDIQYESDTVNIETLAHYIIASRQILSDVPRLEAHINNRLIYGLNLVLDQQVLYGDGTGQNFGGLMTDAQVQDAGAAGTETAIDHIRHGVTLLQQANYYNVNGIVLNPEDWEAIETAKGSDGHYIWVNVQNGGTQQLWRIPVVVSNSMQAGDFLMGDFTMGAALYNREGITVRTSESHADLFVRNGVAILAELRAGLGVELPKAFVKGMFGADEGAGGG